MTCVAQDFECKSSNKQNLARNAVLQIVVSEGGNIIPDVRVYFKDGEYWVPPAESDFEGRISIGLDSTTEIDTVYFEHSDYFPFKFVVNFEDHNFIECIVQLKKRKH